MFPRWLAVLVVVAAWFALAGLWHTVWATRRFGQRRPLAPPTGSELEGIQYALFAGMMPWAKESARRHLPTFAAGVMYHVGIAAGFLVLVATLLSQHLGAMATTTLFTLSVVGAAAGAGLLVKRQATFALRAISTPDDFVANSLVTAFLIAAATTLKVPRFAALFLVIATLLLVYMPLGKIRHCVLFFVSRITFGRFFGRRGVLPHRTAEVGDSHVGR
jgi:hypothetical protein